MDNIPLKIKVGTRGSPLAMAQTRTVCAEIARYFPEINVEVVIIRTSGDWRPADGEVPLSEAEGGKGQFAKEIEAALLGGGIDCAVHSMKDMDSHLPDGLVIDHMLPREDVRDVLLLRGGDDGLANNSQKEVAFSMLKQGANVATCSVRRAAFMKAKRPDLNFLPLRGNVRTRIDKLRGENALPDIDCTLLAIAGLKRLGMAEEADVILSVDEMLPAAGQGAVGIEIRQGDEGVLSIFSRISDFNTVLCVKSERAALAVLDGSCHTPIGAYAMLDKGAMNLRLQVTSHDGLHSYYEEETADISDVQDAMVLGVRVAEALKAQLPDGFLS